MVFDVRFMVAHEPTYEPMGVSRLGGGTFKSVVLLGVATPQGTMEIHASCQ